MRLHTQTIKKAKPPQQLGHSETELKLEQTPAMVDLANAMTCSSATARGGEPPNGGRSYTILLPGLSQPSATNLRRFAFAYRRASGRTGGSTFISQGAPRGSLLAL